MTQKSKMNIAVIEQNKLYRESLITVINQIDDFNVVYDSDGLQNNSHSPDSRKVDLVLIDYNLLNGKSDPITDEVVKLFPDTKTIIITDYSELYTLEESISKGITNLIYKSADKKEFERIIRLAFSNNAIHEIR